MNNLENTTPTPRSAGSSRQTFISYSKRDSEFSLKLANDLEGAGHRVWIDREIGGGQQWRRTIEEALNVSAEMVVVVSPNSIRSRWVQHESSIAYGSGKAIIPILLEAVPEKENFVWMDEIQFIDFSARQYEDALSDLLRALQPPNPIQDLLDQEVSSYRQTGDLIGEAMLVVLEQNRHQLIVNADAEELIEKSQKAVRFQRRLLRGGIGLVGALVLIALAAIGASYQAGVNVRNSLATNQAASTRISDAETQGALVGAVATAAVEQATAYGIEAAAQFAEAATQAAALQEQASVALTAAADAGQKVMDAERALKEIFEDSGLVILGEGPRAMVKAGTLIWVVNRDSNSIQSINPVNGQVGPPIPVGLQPIAITYDGRSLWVANQGDDTVSRVDPVTRQITVFPIGDGPRALLFAAGSLWVANEFENTVKRVAIGTGEVEGVIEVPAGPVGIAFDGANIWVGSFSANVLNRISPSSMRITRTLPVEAGPADLLWDGVSLWVSVRVGDALQQIDTRLNRITKTIPVADAPSGLAFDGSNLWVAARGADLVQMIDREAGTVLASYPVGNFPQTLLWDGANLWAANYDDNSAQRLDRVQGAILARIPTDDDPGSVVFAGGFLWVANRGGNTVQQVDISTNDVVASIQVEGTPNQLTFDGRYLWVTDTGRNLVYALMDLSGRTPIPVQPPEGEESILRVSTANNPVNTSGNGGYLWVVSQQNDRVLRVDLNDLSLVQDFAVGDAPSRWLAQGDEFWVSFQNQSRIIQYSASGEPLLDIDLDGGLISDMVFDGTFLWVAVENNGVVLKVDVGTGEVLLEIPVNEGPIALYLLAGDLWVVSRASDSLQRINVESGLVIQTLAVGEEPGAITSSGSRLWISLGGDNGIVVIDLGILNRVLDISLP